MSNTPLNSFEGAKHGKYACFSKLKTSNECSQLIKIISEGNKKEIIEPLNKWNHNM